MSYEHKSETLGHEEWKEENSLTSPEDRNREVRWRPTQGKPSLNDSETNYAMETLNNDAFTKKFPRIDRTYADPAIPLQTIGLLSFVPAKGATPNANGVFGFAKLRGNFNSTFEADQHAENLIRNHDSYHQIYHCYVGRPFPITSSSKYSAETAEIDIRKETTQAISQNIKDKKQEEQKIVAEIKQREENLLEETRRAEETGVDPYENYIVLKVKKAQLMFTYQEHQKKMAEVKDIIIKTRAEIEELDQEHPTFKDAYFEKYMKARRDAGIKDDNDALIQENFIRFMVEDIDLGF
jgi:hypothetical protein